VTFGLADIEDMPGGRIPAGLAEQLTAATGCMRGSADQLSA
jgi:hypothetical protein